MGFGHYAGKDENLKDSYIVWSPGATQPPTQVFQDRPSAIKVAHLMASKNPGSQFAVCKIVGTAKTVVAKYESFEE